ncbi:MAG: VCBS repeat-containing protein [Verrucomicrobiota bacterium]
MKNHINRPGLIKPLEFVLALLSSHAVFASGLIIPEIQAPRGNDKALVELAITDPEGSIYVAGTFVGGARFGENISLESSGQTPFVAKLNSNGQWLWARIGGNAKNTCAVVRNDELLVGGYGGSGTNAFGQIEILSANTGQVRQNIVMDHIGEGLREGWSKINTLAVARDNSIYVGGDFTKKFQVGGSLIQNTIRRANIADNQSEENNANLVIIKLDATGNYQWHVVAGSMADWGPEAKNGPATLCSTETMEVDGAGNLYAAGILRNSGSRGGVGDSINIYSKFTQVGAQSQIAWEGGVQPKNGSITWARQAVFLSKISPDGAIEYFNVHGLNHYRRASPSDSWIYSYNPAQKEDRRLFFESRDPSIHWVSSLKYSNGFLYLGGILEQFFSLERNEWENQPFLLVGDNLDLDVIARRATQKAGFVAKFRADTGLRLPTDPRVVFDDDQRRSNDSTRKNNVRRLEVGDDSVYVSGDCGTYLGVWTDIDRLPEKPDPQTNLVSLQKNIYVAALDSQLKPKWLRSTADPANVPAPNELNPSVLVWDQLNGRLWYGGSYGDSRDYPNQPELVLGGLSLKRSLKVLGRRVESFLGVLRPDGDHLESVRLLVKSRYGPLTINGFQQLGEDGGTVEVEMPRGGWLTNVVPAAVYLTRSNRLELDERRSVQLPYRTEDWSVSASDLLDSYRLVFEVGTKVTPWGIMIQSLLSESTLGLIQQRFVSVPDFGDDYLGSTDEIGAAIAAELSNQIATNRSLYLQFAELVPPEVRTPLTRAILEDGYASGHTAEASRRFLEHAQSENGAFFFRAIPESEAHYESLAKTRRISEGFTILTTGDRVAANRYSFALNSDLEIEAEWSTDHILEVANYVSDVGVANENLGNPSPAVGRHWIREGTRQDAFIDGIVNDLDPAAYGTRYLAAQYVSEGVARPPGSVESSVTVNLIEPTLLSRLQVRQFSMTGPAKITYRWEKQYRVLVSASTERANRLPFIQTNSIGFQSWGDGSGEYWLRAGAYLQIGSRSVGNNRSLSGWRNGIGEFPSLEGSLSHPRLTHLTDGGDRYFLIVTNLGRPTRVMWMFDNRVFRQDVAIGGALDLASVSLAVAAEGVGSLDPNVPPGTKTIVDAPPGSTVEDMAVWDDVGRRLYPVRPGITQFEWATDQKDNPIVVQVVSGFTGDRIPDSDSGFFPDPDGAGTDAYRYRHLTRTPGVLLDASPTDGSFFLGLRYSESDGSAAGGIFTATRPGRSVLLFSDSPIRDVAAVGNRTQEALRVRVVESRNWDRELDRISGTNRATGSWNLPWRERLLSGPVSTGIDFTHPLHLTPMPVNVVSETVVVPGDFDGDGVRDLLLLGLGQEVRLHRGGRFGESPQILSSLAETRLDSAGIAGDLDGDGDLDFVRATSAGTAYVYLNRGGPQPFLGVEPEEVAVGIPPVAMQLVELSHPGRLDLLVASGGTVLRFEGRDPAKSGPIFATERSENLAARIGVVGSVTALTVGDQDGDGKMDLVVGEENGAIHLLHGLGGKDLFAAEVEHFGTGSRIASLALGNVLGDGGQEILALVGGREGPGEIQVLDAKGGALSFNTSTNGVTSRSFALLPPDASGHSPVVFGGTGGVIQWAPGTDEERTLNSTGSVIGLGSLGVGDLDGDGLEDLYVVEKTLPQVNLFPSGGNGPLAKGPVDAAVGSALQSSFDRSLQGAAYVLPGVKSNALYNARIHPPRGVTGPIIPVNERYDPGRFDELVVAWYEVREGIEWPYQPVRYEPHWPEHPGGVGPGTGTLQRIVIASRLGSEGMTWGGRLQGALDPEHWDGISIYSQPDPTLPGYNPNEEHARIYPSLLSAPGIPISAAFALRDDLNVSKRLIKSRPGTLRPSDYTSDPFVLVEHRNRDTGSIGMTVYAVEREDPDAEDSRLLDLPGAVGNRYVFRYQMNAGERVTAPYPMNLVLGLSICANTVPDPFAVGSVPNGTVYRNGPGRRTYFVDHKGEGWAVSGDGVLDVHLFYRLDPDFWYPTSLLDPARSTGDCVPWLPTWNPILEGSPDRGSVRGAFANRMEDANYPTRIEFLTSWPTNAPTLKAGETLTFAGGEYKADHPEAVGLPGVVGWAAGEVVFDSLNPLMSSASKGNYTARVIAPLEERIISLPVDTLADRLKPAAGNVTVVGTEYRFDELPPSLRRRIFYDPLRSIQGTNGALGLRGYVNDRTLGDPDLTTAPSSVYVLEPNILTKSEVEQLRGLSRDEGG